MGDAIFPARFAIRAGTVLDGTGAPGRRADVIVADGYIDAVNELQGAGSDRLHEIDASGLVVAPGFIDLHTHCDFSLPAHPRAPSMVRQGVTTVVVGNCGFSTAPVPTGEPFNLLRGYTAFLGKDLDWSWRTFGEFLDRLRSLPLAVNVAPLVGHGTVRAFAMGYDDRPATNTELDRMRNAVDEAMSTGAFGLSSGLIYPPGTYAPTAELVALAEVVARHRGFYATHMRNEGPLLMEAVAEAVQVAAGGGVPLQLSHHKVLGRPNWGMTERSLAYINEQRRGGLDVTCDQYPYEASSTNMAALLPGWAQAGGTGEMQSRLRDPEVRSRIRDELLHGPPDGPKTREFEPDLVTIASVGGTSENLLVGRSLDDLAADRQAESVDVFLDLLAQHGGSMEVVVFAIGREDLERVMQDPHVAIASDGWTLDPSQGGLPHPRSYGTYARVLGHFVREVGVLELAEAVRKMTSLPARRLGLGDRGRLEPGHRADLVVFDPDRVVDRATFLAPHQFCDGVAHVIVNGAPVILAGEDTSTGAGSILSAPRR